MQKHGVNKVVNKPDLFYPLFVLFLKENRRKTANLARKKQDLR